MTKYEGKKDYLEKFINHMQLHLFPQIYFFYCTLFDYYY